MQPRLNSAPERDKSAFELTRLPGDKPSGGGFPVRTTNPVELHHGGQNRPVLGPDNKPIVDRTGKPIFLTPGVVGLDPRNIAYHVSNLERLLRSYFSETPNGSAFGISRQEFQRWLSVSDKARSGSINPKDQQFINEFQTKLLRIVFPDYGSERSSTGQIGGTDPQKRRSFEEELRRAGRILDGLEYDNRPFSESLEERVRRKADEMRAAGDYGGALALEMQFRRRTVVSGNGGITGLARASGSKRQVVTAADRPDLVPEARRQLLNLINGNAGSGSAYRREHQSFIADLVLNQMNASPSTAHFLLDSNGKIIGIGVYSIAEDSVGAEGGILYVDGLLSLSEPGNNVAEALLQSMYSVAPRNVMRLYGGRSQLNTLYESLGGSRPDGVPHHHHLFEWRRPPQRK